jgi:hypothetical protein
MSREAPAGWIDRRVRAAMRSETDALHAAIAELRTIVQALSAEMGSSAAQMDAGLSALRVAMEGDERVEKLRLRVEGLSAQHRWDTDQLRQSLTALAERLPLAD